MYINVTFNHFSYKNVKLNKKFGLDFDNFCKKICEIDRLYWTAYSVYTLLYTVQYVEFYLALLDVKEDIGHTGPVAAPRLQDQPEVVVAGGLTQLKLVLW